jgi:hypothetical protein
MTTEQKIIEFNKKFVWNDVLKVYIKRSNGYQATFQEINDSWRELLISKKQKK